MRDIKKKTFPKLSLGQWILFPIIAAIIVLSLVIFYTNGGFYRSEALLEVDPIYGKIEGMDIVLSLLGAILSAFGIAVVVIVLLFGIITGLSGEW